MGSTILFCPINDSLTIKATDYIVLDEQGIKDNDLLLDIGGLDFEFLFNFESC
jgi:hypothetical protein